MSSSNTENGTTSQKFKFVKASEINGQTMIGERTIQDGIYAIQTAINEEYVLDVNQASKSNCANIQLFRNVEEGEWKDPSVTEAKGTFKWYLLVIAAGFLVGTVANFNYLGGIDGIMAMLSQMFEVVWWKTDFVGLLGMIFLPVLAILCLFLAFKKEKKHYLESE